MKTNFLTELLAVQQRVISMIALSSDVSHILELIASSIEDLLEDSDFSCSILLLDGDKLRHGAAPSLHPDYCAAIDGVEIGPKTGSCGTAIYTQAQVLVSNIEQDPLWEDFKDIALKYDLRACWSIPILASKGEEVLGSFALYYSSPKSPDSEHLSLIMRFADLSGIAIEKCAQEARTAALTKELQLSNDKFSSFAAAMPDLVLVFDDEGRYVDVYGADTNSLYVPASQLVGRKITEMLPKEEASGLLIAIERAVKTGVVQILEYKLNVMTGLRNYEGRLSRISDYDSGSPETKHVVLVARDVTERKIAQQTIEQLSFYDALTSLPNRSLLIKRLQAQIDRAWSNKQYGAVIYIDLDNFKRINESLGHGSGDQLLMEVSRRLAGILSARDLVARVSADEFVILVDSLFEHVSELSNVLSILSARIFDLFEERFTLKIGDFMMSASLGVSVFGFHEITAAEVIKQAESAMFRAKRDASTSIMFFDPELEKGIRQRLKLEQDVHDALQKNIMTAFFQPQVSAEGRVVGLEALVRWPHPERGMIPPSEFIPIAEQFGIIGQLQALVLNHACCLLVAMDNAGLIDDDFTVSINISACQFKKADFESSLLGVLSHYGVSPSRIVLEITESMLLEDIDLAVDQMHRMRSFGFKFSIDDFGTGYSSLSYLQSLPVDEIKIDRSFIMHILDSDVGLSIVHAIVGLAKSLSFSVVAEGIEELEQLRSLQVLEVDGLQGFYVAKPMDAEHVIEWFASSARALTEKSEVAP